MTNRQMVKCSLATFRFRELLQLQGNNQQRRAAVLLCH